VLALAARALVHGSPIAAAAFASYGVG
jgi:hypothetical protein